MARCNLFQQYNVRQKRPFSTQEVNDLKARRQIWNRILNAANSTVTAQLKRVQEMQIRQRLQDEWISSTGEVMRVFPEQGKRIQDFLVREFGQKARFLGLDPQRNYSLAGEVRYNLETFQATAEGMVNIAGKINSISKLDAFQKVFKNIVRDKNLTDAQSSLLFFSAVEDGRIPTTLSTEVSYVVNTLGNTTTPVAEYLQRKHNRFLGTAQDLGLNKQEIDELVDAATELSTAFDEVRAVATALGVSIPDLENLGYFSRIITEDFKLRLQDLDVPELFQTLRADIVELSSLFGRSRNTVHYLPWDEAIAAQMLDIDVPTLRLMLDNPTQFRNYLEENLTADQLDGLVDSGVFAKLPMSAIDVYDYFKSQYQLPYESLSRMFVTDPVLAMQKYSASLMQAAGSSALVRGVLDGRAFSAGWTVDGSAIKSNPVLYGDFVPLGKYLDRWAAQANITPAQALVSMGITADPTEALRIIGSFENAYVHPVVADQWSAMMTMSTNPAMLGQTGYILHAASRLYSKLLISSNTMGYILNNTLGSIKQTVAGGGNIMRYLPNLMEVTKALKHGFEAFDDTKVYFKDVNGAEYTRRGLVKEFLKRRNQGIAPGTTRLRFTKSQNSFIEELLGSPQAVMSGLNEVMQYTMAKGTVVGNKKIPLWERPGRFTKASLRKASTGLDRYFSSIASVANILELTGKLTVLDTVLMKVDGFDEAVSAFGQTVSSFQFTRFNSLDEAFRHVDEYFINPYGVGRLVGKASAFLFPFAVWRMMNPPMQMRHIIRHPQWYMGYLRLHALNQDELSQDERAVEAAIEPWVLKAMPWYIGKTHEGKPMMLLPTSYDPIADALVFFNDTGDKVQRMLGMGAQLTADQRLDVRNETAQDFLNELVSSMSLPVKSMYELISGVDTFTGKKIDENPAEARPDFVGINWNPRLYLLVSKIPFLSKLDAMNPGGMFGTAPTFDSFTGQTLTPGTPSIFGGTRSKRDTRRMTFESSPLWAQTLMLAGMNIRTVDYDRNLQNTYSDIDVTISYLEKSINSNRQEITLGRETGKVSESEYARRRAQIEDQVSIWGQLMLDKMRLDSYMRKYNVTPTNVLRDLDKKGLEVRQLPLPGDEQLRGIAEKVIRVDRELDEAEQRGPNE
jgi:hypothetical protein